MDSKRIFSNCQVHLIMINVLKFVQSLVDRIVTGKIIGSVDLPGLPTDPERTIVYHRYRKRRFGNVEYLRPVTVTLYGNNAKVLTEEKVVAFKSSGYFMGVDFAIDEIIGIFVEYYRELFNFPMNLQPALTNAYFGGCCRYVRPEINYRVVSDGSRDALLIYSSGDHQPSLWIGIPSARGDISGEFDRSGFVSASILGKIDGWTNDLHALEAAGSDISMEDKICSVE